MPKCEHAASTAKASFSSPTTSPRTPTHSTRTRLPGPVKNPGSPNDSVSPGASAPPRSTAHAAHLHQSGRCPELQRQVNAWPYRRSRGVRGVSKTSAAVARLTPQARLAARSQQTTPHLALRRHVFSLSGALRYIFAPPSAARPAPPRARAARALGYQRSHYSINLDGRVRPGASYDSRRPRYRADAFEEPCVLRHVCVAAGAAKVRQHTRAGVAGEERDNARCPAILARVAVAHRLEAWNGNVRSALAPALANYPFLRRRQAGLSGATLKPLAQATQLRISLDILIFQ